MKTCLEKKKTEKVYISMPYFSEKVCFLHPVFMEKVVNTCYSGR